MSSRLLYLPPKRPGRFWVTYLGGDLQPWRTTVIDDAEFEVALTFWLCRCGQVLVYPADERAWSHRCPCCTDGVMSSGVTFDGVAPAVDHGQCL